jgi:hypothetical protein
MRRTHKSRPFDDEVATWTIGTFQAAASKDTRERGLAHGAHKRKMGWNNVGFLADGNEGMGVRMIAEPTGRRDQAAAPEAPVGTTPSGLVRDAT